MDVTTHSTITAAKAFNPVKVSIADLMAESSPTINKNMVKQVKNDKYRAVTIPNLCLTHSVKTNPSGHFLLIMGPKYANPKIGIDPQRVYTNKPCNPDILPISAYVVRIPHPIAA